MGGEPGKGEVGGILLRDLALTLQWWYGSPLRSSSLPHTPSVFPSTCPHSWRACQCSSTVGFIILTCLFCSARSFPRASMLEHSLEICLGHSPIPRHLLLPGPESIP